MKIKCPGCSAVLNVPETAAGKIVKCPCGKQLRAPGGAAAKPSTSAPAKPTAGPVQQQRKPQAAPAARRPAAKPTQPIAQRPPGPTPVAQPQTSSGFGGDLFDELTDKDLQPVKEVRRHGAASGSSSGSGTAVESSGGSRRDFLGTTGNIVLGVGAIAIGGGIIYWDQTREPDPDESSRIRIRRRKSPTYLGIVLILAGFGWMGKAFGFSGDDEPEEEEVSSVPAKKQSGGKTSKGSKGTGIGLLIFAGLLAAVGTYQAIFRYAGEEMSRRVGLTVGALLPSVVMAAIGVWLLTRKPKSNR